jgi:peptidoglycan endopeptidase LytE
MSLKQIVNGFLLSAILLASFAIPGTALAWSGCGTTYMVQWGDTLSSVADRCGTTVAAIRQANPNLGYWLYAGQTIYLPGPYVPQPVVTSKTYVVQWGDTLRNIAARMNVTVNDILTVNPQIWNPNWIFFGQVINIPAPAQYYAVQPGDTLRIIATRFGTSVYSLKALNPQIWNPNIIYIGQMIRLW